MTEFKAASTGESEAQWRQFLSYLFAQSSTGTSSTGVLAGLSVGQTATASGSVLVGRGAAVVQSSLTAGAAPLISNADKTLDVLTSSPMGALPRNDLVIFNADTAAIEAVIGVANASPTDPSVSANHVKLARIRNAANASTIPNGSIDDLRAFTTLNLPAAPQWQTYTPVWSQNGGTTLNVGSGSITGQYRVSGSGSRQVCTVRVQLTRAADTNVGTAGYLFTLPVPGVDFAGTGSGVVVRNNGEFPVVARMIASSTVALIRTDGQGRISNSSPGSWVAGDIIQFTLTYFTS